MRVLQIIQQPQFRGAEMFACQLSSELLKRGIQTDIVYLFSDNQDLIAQFPQLQFIDLRANRSRRLYDFPAYQELSDLIVDGRYDIIQANAGDTLKYAALSKMLFRWKAKLVFRNANKLSAFIRNRIHASLTRFFLRRCNFIISVSENCRLDICEFFPPAVDLSAQISIGTYGFEEIHAKQRDTTEPVWINIGSFVPEKNHEFLLEVFAAFVKERQAGYLWLVGDGKLREALNRRTEALGLKDRVIFWGYRADPIALLKAADVMVMPSKVEGLPGVILEAFACGVPVVASSVGGISEVVENGVTGACIDGFDRDSYVKSVDRLLTDKLFRNQVVSTASALVLKEYLMETICRRFGDCYDLLTKRMD